MTNLEKQMKIAIKNQFGIDLNAISMETNFDENLYLDSLQKLELVMLMEDVADIEISDEDSERLKTFGDYYEHLKTKVDSDYLLEEIK